MNGYPLVERRLIDGLFDEVDVNVEKDTLLDNFKLGELLVLSAKFIELLELLVVLMTLYFSKQFS